MSARLIVFNAYSEIAKTDFEIPMTSNESYEASVLLVLKVLVLNLATKDKHWLSVYLTASYPLIRLKIAQNNENMKFITGKPIFKYKKSFWNYKQWCFSWLKNLLSYIFRLKWNIWIFFTVIFIANCVNSKMSDHMKSVYLKRWDDQGEKPYNMDHISFGL